MLLVGLVFDIRPRRLFPMRRHKPVIALYLDFTFVESTFYDVKVFEVYWIKYQNQHWT